jgi:hypothetical protein
MLKNRKAQSTLEYIILIAAVIAVMLIFLAGESSPFRTALNSTMGDATNSMVDMSGRLGGSRGDTPTNP